MFKNFARKARDLTITTLVFTGCGYSFIHYRTTQNNKRYVQAMKSQTLRDASRLTNQSFGISWGFQADDTIMSRIDSGDLLFIRFECMECITPTSMIRCLFTTSLYLEEQYHTVGYAYRDESGLYVLYNEFGETKVKNYCELISLPYIKSLTLQKRSKNLLKAHVNLRKEVDFDKDIEQSSLQFVNRVNRLLGGKRELSKVEDLLSGEQKINIRTQTNNTLRSL